MFKFFKNIHKKEKQYVYQLLNDKITVVRLGNGELIFLGPDVGMVDGVIDMKRYFEIAKQEILSIN